MITKRSVRFAVQSVALMGLTLTLPACATITRGTTQQFTVESSPPSAKASTSSGFSCDSTPCTWRMPRKDPFTLTVSKEGYVSQTEQVTTKMSPGGTWAIAGNIIFGGIVGIVVDAFTGATQDLSPNPVTVTLKPELKTSEASAAESVVAHQ